VGAGYRRDVDCTSLLALFDEVATAIRGELDRLADWGRADGHEGQYVHDVVADDVAVPALLDAGLGVISEESGGHRVDRDIVVVVDPIDGSTNASLGLPWFATSLAAVDQQGVVAALVVNQAIGVRYTAARGQGAWRDGAAIAPSACDRLGDAIVVVNDLPPPLGARQFRVYGAAALDLCAVADGTFDGFVDCGVGLAPWDYLGALLVCTEAGAAVGELADRPLEVIEAPDRRSVVAAGTVAVRDQLRAVVSAQQPASPAAVDG